MSSPVLFSEKQRFTQWWLWLLLLAVNGTILFDIIRQITLSKQSFGNPNELNELLIAGGITLAVTLLMFSCNLQTRLTFDGIAVRFFPLHFKFRQYSWEELASAEIRHYSPLAEYGGWGLRYSISGYGKAYNVSGKEGLQLEFTNGKKLLIGTKKAAELKEVLLRIKEQK